MPEPKKLNQDIGQHEAAHALVSEALRPGSVQQSYMIPGSERAGGNTVIAPPTLTATPIHGFTPASKEQATNELATSYAGALGQGIGQPTLNIQDERGLQGDKEARMKLLGQMGAMDKSLWGGPMVDMTAQGLARANEVIAEPGSQNVIKNLGSRIAIGSPVAGQDIRKIIKQGE